MKAVSLFLCTCLVAISTTALAQSVPPLINYQGRLTDQTGAPLTAGVYGIQFRIWDSPTATNASDLIWGQQYGNLAVQSNGVFSVILGSPGGSAIPGTSPAVNSLAYAFGSSNVFLGVTIAVSNGVALNSPSEIQPRQLLLSVPFAFTAANAGTAASAAVAATVLPGSITTTSLATNSVTLTNLAPRVVGTNVPLGGFAISSSSGNYITSSLGDVPNLTVTITTSGRPVFIGLISDGNLNSSYVLSTRAAGETDVATGFTRDANVISSQYQRLDASSSTSDDLFLPPSSNHHIDIAPPGVHTYTFRILAGNSSFQVVNVRLVAYEL